MCGIAGLYSLDGKVQGRIGRMCSAMSHRGPDAEGIYTDETVELGHRRLSIIDLSEGANQPFHDASGRYVMVFNGEIYNFRDVKKKLDYPFRTQGDSEVLLAAFIQWGPACLELIHGMFAFAIWDTVDKSLFLCRDRLGVKPLYYCFKDQRLAFASELRAVLASGVVGQPRLDTAASGNYLMMQSFWGPASPVDGIRQLKAGHYMRIKEGRIEEKRYWSIYNTEKAFDFEDQAAVRKRIRELLSLSVEKRLVSDVPVGAFLSGGIDSSAVVGLMAEVSSAKPVTFNISFSEKEYDEAHYAKLIAKRFSTDHHVIRMEPEIFLDELTNALDSMDVPSADGINTYVVSKAIKKEGITVALSGIGGDELFAGYPFFRYYMDLRGKSRMFGLTGPLRKLLGRMMQASGSGRSQRMGSILAADDLGIGSLYPIFRAILTPGQIKKFTSFPPPDVSSLLDLGTDVENLPLLSQVSVAEYSGYTQHTLLKDTDQMSMAVSLEVREPFFDHELISFILSVPDELKYPRYAKSLLVESLDGLLPDEVVHRKKQGFLMPWPVWMKGQLRSFCDVLIRKLATRRAINGQALIAYWERFLSGDARVRWTELWVFVVLEYWLEKNNIDA